MTRLIATAFVLLLTAAAFAAEWPHFRGPDSNNISPEQGINKSWNTKAPTVLWKMALEKGFAGPAVDGGVLYIVDHADKQDIVRAVKLEDGSKLWEYAYDETAAKGPPGMDNYGYHKATPCIDDGMVYTISHGGQVFCLDAKTGKMVWALALEKEFGGKPAAWHYAGSPVIDGDKLILAPAGKDATLAAVDKKTGKVLWKGGGTVDAAYCTPIIATVEGKKQYVHQTGTALIGVSPDDGKLLWQVEWKTPPWGIIIASPVIAGENRFFVTSGYGRGCGLVEVKDGQAKVVKESKEIQSHIATPIFKDGVIYCTSDPGKLVCMDAATLDVKWSQNGFEKGGLIAADGALIVMDGKTGELTCAEMSPAGYKELGRIKPLAAVAQSWTAPILAEGKLIVRNAKELAVVDLK